METHQRFVLLNNIENIAKEIEPREIARALAHEHRILPIILLKDVARQPSPRKQAHRLVELLASCGPRAFEAFCDALAANRHDKLVQRIRRAERDTRVADSEVLNQLRKVTSKLPIPRNYVDVCRNSAEAFTNDVWVEHLLPLFLKKPFVLTDYTRDLVADETTRQAKAEVLFQWVLRRVNAHGHSAFFALLDALSATYPHVAEEFWRHLTTIVIVNVDPEMALEGCKTWNFPATKTGTRGVKQLKQTQDQTPSKSKTVDSSSKMNGDKDYMSSDGEMDYHSELNRAVEVIGEANSSIKRMDDRVKGLEIEKRELETKARVAIRESQNLRTELERVNEEKSAKAKKDAELKKSRDRKLKILQEELDTKENLMADKELELRKRELELDQRMMQMRKQQADVERQLLALLDKEKSFEGRIHHQAKRDEELKRKEHALSARESAVADKEDRLMRRLEDMKKNELNQKKFADGIARKSDEVNEMKKNNEDIAIQLGERKRELDKKEKGLELSLAALRRDKAELSRKEESLEKREERVQQEDMNIREKQLEINQKARNAEMLEREKQQFNMEKQKWAAECARVRSKLDNDRRELRERELQLKANARDQQLKEKEWRSVKDALEKHLQDQEHIERSIQAIETEQERLESDQQHREKHLEKQLELRQVDLISSFSSKEGELVKRIGNLQKKEFTIKTREAKLKDEEFELRKRGYQVRRRPGSPSKSPPLKNDDQVRSRPGFPAKGSHLKDYDRVRRRPSSPGNSPPLKDNDEERRRPGYPANSPPLKGVDQERMRPNSPGNSPPPQDDEQVRRRPGSRGKSPPMMKDDDRELGLSLEDVSETQTPVFTHPSHSLHPSKAYSHTPTDQGSTPESGYSEDQPGVEYKILQRGPTSAHHRNQAFSVKPGTVQTVAEMKAIVSKQEGIPATWQQFYFNGKLLPDNSPLPSPENLVNGILDMRLNVPRGNMPLITRMSGISRRIEFELNETVAAAKTRIYKSEGIPPHQQSLFYGDMELQDKVMLRDYQVQAGTEICLKVRYVVIVVIPNNRMLPMAVDDLDKVGSLKALIYEETRMHIDHQILTYGATTLAHESQLADYRIVEGSRIFVSYVIPIVLDSNKETFTLSIDLQTTGRKVKEMIFKYRGFHIPLQNLVQHGRLLDDNVAIVDQLPQGGAVQLYHGNILILDENDRVFDLDVQPWHNVAKIKERIAKKTGIQTRQQHLMLGDIELKTVNRSVKYFGVKRADVLRLRCEPKT